VTHNYCQPAHARSVRNSGDVRVLVTGGRGFIGAHLCAELDARGHDVLPVGRTDGDLAEAGVAERLLEQHQPELVVHLAARVGTLVGDDDPLGTIRDNAAASALVARACAKQGAQLAYGSTAEVYHAAPRSLYGLTKRWGEEAVLLHCPGASLLRFSLPYGSGLAAGARRGAIVSMLDQALRGEPIPAYRGVERSWCWIGDAARGAALVIEDGGIGAWNVGRDDAHTPMVELARMACRLVGASADLVEEIDPPVPERPLRVSSARLEALGWNPEVELEQGMRRTLEWLRSEQTVR
jgi:dTDP-glucose 4,6-dehydratase